jgi:hypothetical protein
VPRTALVLWLCSAPCLAQAQLTPSEALRAQLELLEERRPPIEEAQARASTLRIGAAAGYGLATLGVAWAVIELALSTQKPSAPLTGIPYTIKVPTALMFSLAGVLLVAGVALHITAHVIDSAAEKKEDALDAEERPIRRDLAEARDRAVDAP